ncbi:MAG: ParB N-terminal domain-containing protein [Richelia sp. RM2_1_2]|nr:ParB N-terminal domain-containing protein [Richelia sp. RM2_1_2]
MGVLPFHLLRCSVSYGFLSPDDIYDSVIIDETDETAQHKIRLIDSIKQEGLRNPLILIANVNKPTFVTVGHHRLWAAKRAGLTLVPVIVNDWCNRYPTFEVLHSIDDVRSKFLDQPNLVKSFTTGVSTSEPLINGQTWWTKT